jgi:anti-sigma factor RsiW
VAQLHNGHLTTEQLSAFFDKQLSLEEQAAFDAHVSTCQECQRRLADLRLTVALLRALPEEEVPRSFVLPGRLAPFQERPVRQGAATTPVSQGRRVWLHTLRRSVRAVSALAAVLALIFIISGILPPLHFGAGETASAPVPASASSPTGASKAASGAQTPQAARTAILGPHEQAAATKTPPPTQIAGPTPTAAATSNTFGPRRVQTPPVPPLIDLGQPQGRLILGALLLALSIIGLIITRRRRGTAH